jgi:hypothetical protein
MGDFKRISKEQAKTVKHLLNSAYSNDSRPILRCINVDIEKDQIGTANGFLLTFIKYKESRLAEIFPENGSYSVQLGKIGKDNIIEVDKFISSGMPYPNLNAIVRPLAIKPTVTFGVAKDLLERLTQLADGMLIFHVLNETTAIEMQYAINGAPCFSVLMPMHISDSTKIRTAQWHPQEFVPVVAEKK